MAVLRVRLVPRIYAERRTSTKTTHLISETGSGFPYCFHYQCGCDQRTRAVVAVAAAGSVGCGVDR